jgi:SAM-dependent methyltransferase
MSRWYPRLAAVLLPLVAAALAWVVYKDARRHKKTVAVPQAPAAPVANIAADPKVMAETFDHIYKSAVWGADAEGKGTSGGGSTLRNTAVYRTFLQQFMQDNNIKSVVDAGCGDWEFSQALDWTGIDYKGFDIVPSVVEQDTAKFGKPNIQFFAANIVDADLPPADLLLCKEVLQHLPTKDVQKFLAQLPKYKHVLLTNGIDPVTFTSDNHDIQVGDYRALDVTAPPFDQKGIKVLNYWDGVHMHQVVYIAPQATAAMASRPSP